MSFRIPMLGHNPDTPFPDPRGALIEPDGLLAFGGDLSPKRLLNAYAHGIFPWYSEDQPILWWSPDPRTVFRTDRVHLSRRFRQQLRKLDWTIRCDTQFDRVVAACADSPRNGQTSTWIVEPMRAAYSELHRLGHAHSMEVMDGDALVGGLYGVSIGQMFFGESMFSAVSGGSKVALAALARMLHEWGWPIFDAQVESDHLLRMGAQVLSREAFLRTAEAQCRLASKPCAWTEPVGERKLDWLLGTK